MGKDVTWATFSAHLGGSYIERSYWHSDKAAFDYRDLQIIFDNYTEYRTVSSTTVQQTYTRITVQYPPAGDFVFELKRENILSSISKFFGAQDVEVGNAEFDKALLIKSNNPALAKKMLTGRELRKAILAQQKINLLLSNQKGIWEEQLPEGVRELAYFTEGEITDIETLESLYGLFRMLVDRMHEIGVVKL